MAIEHTLLIIKQHAVKHQQEIIEMVRDARLDILHIRTLRPSEHQCLEHYLMPDAWYEKIGANVLARRQAAGLPIEKTAREYAEDVRRSSVKNLTPGPCVFIRVSGENAIARLKALVGPTDPAKAPDETIRGRFRCDSFQKADRRGGAVRNTVHCPDTPESAAREVDLWFNRFAEQPISL